MNPSQNKAMIRKWTFKTKTLKLIKMIICQAVMKILRIMEVLETKNRYKIRVTVNQMTKNILKMTFQSMQMKKTKKSIKIFY